MANFKVALTVWFTVQLPYCYTWYLPTSPSVEYCNTTRQDSSCETELPVFVNRLDSNKRYIPYKYDGFGFVKLPSKSNIKENIGELLQGDRLHKSPYNMTFLTAGSCMMGDTWQTTYTRNTNMWAHLKEAIMLNYQHH
ncbi:transmembrane 9 superfamily member 2-like, partial [Saccoglossus kowalevskii]|uniref:Transmembrane 9 superfamily member 2-like n=1 Tax=Saccoglossus kowalevskii TaxID=10224 RepID=A0ABM0MIZ8_SACKO